MEDVAKGINEIEKWKGINDSLKYHILLSCLDADIITEIKKEFFSLRVFVWDGDSLFMNDLEDFLSAWILGVFFFG